MAPAAAFPPFGCLAVRLFGFFPALTHFLNAREVPPLEGNLSLAPVWLGFLKEVPNPPRRYLVAMDTDLRVRLPGTSECLPAPRCSQPAQGMLITLLPGVHRLSIEKAVIFQSGMGLFQTGFHSCNIILLAALDCGVFLGITSQRFKETRSSCKLGWLLPGSCLFHLRTAPDREHCSEQILPNCILTVFPPTTVCKSLGNCPACAAGEEKLDNVGLWVYLLLCTV